MCIFCAFLNVQLKFIQNSVRWRIPFGFCYILPPFLHFLPPSFLVPPISCSSFLPPVFPLHYLLLLPSFPFQSLFSSFKTPHILKISCSAFSLIYLLASSSSCLLLISLVSTTCTYTFQLIQTQCSWWIFFSQIHVYRTVCTVPYAPPPPRPPTLAECGWVLRLFSCVSFNSLLVFCQFHFSLFFGLAPPPPFLLRFGDPEILRIS